MTWNECVQLVRADLYRYYARSDFRCFVSCFLRIPGFRYTTLFRFCNFLRKRPLLKWTIYPFFSWWYVRIGLVYGIRIPFSCQIGGGFEIEHWGGIWFNPAVIIGRNCTIGHEVTLGHAKSGATAGAPTIGDCVFLGPGAKVVGKITVGNHAMITANTVVFMDVPEKGLVMGNPGRVFSRAGSEDYCSNLYEEPVPVPQSGSGS